MLGCKPASTIIGRGKPAGKAERNRGKTSRKRPVRKDFPDSPGFGAVGVSRALTFSA